MVFLLDLWYGALAPTVHQHVENGNRFEIIAHCANNRYISLVHRLLFVNWLINEMGSLFMSMPKVLIYN